MSDLSREIIDRIEAYKDYAGTLPPAEDVINIDELLDILKELSQLVLRTNPYGRN